MHHSYSDITSRIEEKPTWWDQNGVPRWGVPHPKRCPDIYANEVVVLEIACQQCLTRFTVMLSSSNLEIAMSKGPSLKELVESGGIHYGDPPRHDEPGYGDCHAGATMNCYDLRVIEFWAKNNLEWRRVSELEVQLPDIHEISGR